MLISEFAGNTLLHEQGSYEPQRRSNFALTLFFPNADPLVLAVKDVDLPATAYVQKSIKMFNETMHYAGSVTPFADLTVNFHDYVDQPVLQTLTTWAQTVWDPATGAINFASQYKKSGTLYLLPPGLSGATPGAVDTTSSPTGRQWILQGVWLKSFKPDQFDNENDGDNTLINCVFSIDRAYPVTMAPPTSSV